MASSLYHAAQFVISCGTVTLNLQLSKVLLIRWRNTNGDMELMLPKGRKNIAETLEQAALRETLEETGYTASLLPLPIPTLATSNGNTSSGDLVTEPICVAERNSGSARKIIFWFAAQADATQTPQQMLQEDEDFEAVWEDVESAKETITYDSDREIFMAVLALAKSRQ